MYIHSCMYTNTYKYIPTDRQEFGAYIQIWCIHTDIQAHTYTYIRILIHDNRQTGIWCIHTNLVHTYRHTCTHVYIHKDTHT
jgi:hypothetical protein